MMSFRLETGLTKHAFLLVLWLNKIFIDIFVDKVLGESLFALVIFSRYSLLWHITRLSLRSRDFLCGYILWL